MTDASVALRDAYLRLHPDDAADVLELEPPSEVAGVLADVPAPVAAEVLDGLGPHAATEVLAALGDDVFGRVIAALEPARAALLMARLSDEIRDRKLLLLEGSVATELTELMSYPARSAGHIMDPRPTTFRTRTTADEALRRLRASRPDDFDDVFIVDADGRLVGTVALEDLALARPDGLLDDLVRAAPVAVDALSGIDDVLELAEELPRAVPVVDAVGRLVGLIRTRELIEAAEHEASVGLQTMVGVSRDEDALSPAGFAVRRRLPWLVVNLVTAFLAASVVGVFESTIARVSALAVLMPVVAGQSGNSGAQALAIAMRGLALREIGLGHWKRLVAKETLVGLVNGVTIAVITGVGVFVWSRSAPLAMIIALAMVMSMAVAGLAGASVPMLLKRAGQDPATASSIVLTTITDVVGFLTFLGLATLLSGML